MIKLTRFNNFDSIVQDLFTENSSTDCGHQMAIANLFQAVEVKCLDSDFQQLPADAVVTLVIAPLWQFLDFKIPEDTWTLWNTNHILGGGFKYVLFSPLPWEMIQID